MSMKSEWEKMIAGEVYCSDDPTMNEIRMQVRHFIQAYSSSMDMAERGAILKQMLGGFGETSLIEAPFQCIYGRNIFIGDHSYLNFNCIILDCNYVCIGHHVMVGPMVQFYTAEHPLHAPTRIQRFETAKPITVEDNVWIGGGAIILPGVTVGRNAVVGAGSVVTKSVPPDVVVAGNPARIIRQIDETVE